MRYYAHFGHKDFILALGYRGDLIREYFLNYSESLSNDFTLSDGGKTVRLHTSDIHDWRITFVDTGLHSNIGQRLLRVRHHLEGEAMFLANYADGVSDLPLDLLIKDFENKKAAASFVAVRVPQSFHIVSASPDGFVTRIGPMNEDDTRINGGFFALRREIFDYVREGEELVEEPFRRLSVEKLLATYPYDGFWRPMDTFKDKVTLDRMEAHGDCPWMVWKKPGNTA
jgi:glucose-1-phosphate cytidylyltransferase